MKNPPKAAENDHAKKPKNPETLGNIRLAGSKGVK